MDDSILHDPKVPLRFVPDGQAEGEPPLAYDLQVPLPLHKIAYRRACTVAGVRKWTPGQMLSALVDGARLVWAEEPEAQALYVDAIEETRSRILAWGQRAGAGEFVNAPDDEVTAAFNEAFRETPEYVEAVFHVERAYERYRDMKADNEAEPALRALVAARLFLRGWTLDVPFRRERGADDGGMPGGAVPDLLLSWVPEAHMAAIRDRIEALMEVGQAKAKNSASPSGSPGAAETSTSPTTDPAHQTAH